MQPDSDLPPLSAIKVKPSPSRFAPPIPTTDTPTAGAQRRIGIAVDLSDESAFAVEWSVRQYLRPGDAVILLHVRPTSVLYGADWGAIDLSVVNEESKQKLEDEFDAFTVTKADDVAQPLVEAGIPFKIHIVKDHDMKERSASFVLLANRLCLEVERLRLSAVIMGSRGFGATKRDNSGRLGSVSDYCVRHCVCPVVVVRYPEEKDGGGGVEPVVSVASAVEEEEEEEPEYHDATDHRKGSGFPSVLHESFLLNMIILCYVCIDVYLQLKNLTFLVNPVSD
ncbi:hypothetical protein RHSIM_RhsimUnG0173100 [Rhododendron simsii]|uniref:UspA domain-containing protein n=1 Tax=Rhododendron simsii TaxID=118357 RepID=A0A834L4B7_RHOSS|nr:hypothetical protein RHSIM_RhsimUnG0173100 [Rhododendron simsii]